MPTHDAQSELPGLYTAVEVVEHHIEELGDAGGSAAAEGTKSRAPEEPHEMIEGRRASLVAVKDDLYARITDLGGQWPRTEVGGKHPPTPS